MFFKFLLIINLIVYKLLFNICVKLQKQNIQIYLIQKYINIYLIRTTLNGKMDWKINKFYRIIWTYNQHTLI